MVEGLPQTKPPEKITNTETNTEGIEQ